MSGYWSKSVFKRRGGHVERKFQGAGGRPPTTVGVRKLESLGYHVTLFAWSYTFSRFGTVPACEVVTDGRTDTR